MPASRPSRDGTSWTPAALSAIASLALAAVVAVSLQFEVFGSSAAQYAAAWFALKAAIAGGRLATSHLVLGAHARVSGAPRNAGLWLNALIALDGVTWGAGAMYLSNESAARWGFAPAIICAIAAFDLHIGPPVSRLYLLSMIVLTAIGLLARGGGDAMTVCLALFALAVIVLRGAARSDRRTALLTQRQDAADVVLAQQVQALALAKRQSTSKDRFLAVVSHEVRTPLHGMLGLVRLTSSDLPKISSNALAHYRLQMVEESGLHLERILNDLLDVTLLESGMFQLRPIAFRLLDKVDALTETYTAIAAERGIGFKTYVQPSLEGVVLGDPIRLIQVLHNLLTNAFKFTPLGGTVALEVERLPYSQIIQFIVRDSGPGVPESERAAIFEIFSQGLLGSARPEGHGLGLAISRQLSRAMGGDVLYRPTGPIGSAFVCTLLLPSQLAVVGAPPPPNAAPHEPLARKSNYAGLTVYIADDDEASLLVAASVVRSLGCDLETFDNGYKLLDRFLTTPRRPDAIVIDWDMPKLDGRSATRSIRQHESRNNYRKIPIIGLSANATPAFAAAAVRAGMTVFLTKPCGPQELANAIAAHIGQEARILYDASMINSWSRE